MELDRLATDVAACTRLLVGAQVLGYSGHVSARMADGERFLIQPVADVRAELVPERLLTVGLDGQRLAGDGEPPSEVYIHSEIYRARPDVGAIAHFHHDRTTLFSLVEGVPLVPVKNHASRWGDGIPVHPDPSHIATAAQGAALAATLGTSNGALVRAHGQVVVAEDPRTLFADCVHFVENAETLLEAHLLGPVVALRPEEVAAFLATFDRHKHAAKLWAYYVAASVRAGALPAHWLAEEAGTGR